MILDNGVDKVEISGARDEEIWVGDAARITASTIFQYQISASVESAKPLRIFRQVT